MKRTTTLASFVFAAVFGVAAAGFVGCTSLLGDFEVEPVSGEAGIGSKANGAACANGSECSSSFCTDNVCCESSCSGTCESCKIDPGKCVPVPDGQNPDNECKPEPLPDAGVAPEPDAEPPPPDAGDDAAVVEAGQPDASNEINLPDGGVTQDEAKCSAGVCNGQRACKFPGKEVACGTQFCNSSSQAAGYQCDGKGHCQLDIQTCTSFVCENNECRVDCASTDDCQPTHFCDGDFKCKPKKGNSIPCTSPNECQSGFCPVETGGGVCCDSACDPTEITGATCKKAGAVGKCQCTINCPAGASCRAFYRDADNDTFGDKNASGAVAGSTYAGCTTDSPAAGFSATKTDCDDSDANVRPNQTAYFSTANAKVGFDYNCSGAIEKSVPEYAGSSCQFCYEDARDTCKSAAKCTALNDQSRLLCKPYKSLIIIGGGGGITCGYGTPLGPTNTAGFISTVSCGASSNTYRTCGKCTTKAGVPQVTSSTVQQLCH